MTPINQDVVGRLEEAANLLRDQGADIGLERTSVRPRASDRCRRLWTKYFAIADWTVSSSFHMSARQSHGRFVSWSRMGACQCWIDCVAKATL
jgi:hypothetical protein